MSSPYPHDLWVRLARLDASCEVAVYSTREPDAPADGARRFWIANARRRDDPSRFIEITANSLVEAVSGLVVAAESERFGEGEALARA